jgi:glycosyltransferase involved in cell wall biosynthesis
LLVSNEKKFLESNRTHVLMITNHGVHEWQVIPGMPDTGGQNVYVNQFTEALINLGYRVTITNRGGYPHPKTGEKQSGIHYHPSGFGRIMYLEDGREEFVRKEDMNEQLPALKEDLIQKLKAQDDAFDLIISHYWDAGKLGWMVNGECNDTVVPHVWIPHSLGALKKKNMDPSTWADLRIDERIEQEHEIVKKVDQVVATSTTIRETFMNDYNVAGDKICFLPPCIDVDRIHPQSPDEFADIYDFLAEHTSYSADEIKQRPIITEISRTDKTKRKDVLIKAFAKIKEHVPDALLAVSIDKLADKLYDELMGIIKDAGLEKDVLVLGSVWAQLPKLYNATTVYCTPSVMEGFGMSAQEASATAKPVVSSDLVPFVEEYLLGDNVEEVRVGTEHIRVGESAVVVPADYVDGFAEAITMLLRDPECAQQMGRRGREITIPYFTWKVRSQELLDSLGVKSERSAAT